mgnify:CR=1 FL=1
MSEYRSLELNVLVETCKDVLVDHTHAQLNTAELVSDSVKIKDSEITEPCYIGENVVLRDSKVGPYVSIGAGSLINNSTIVNSLIQKNVEISNANLDNAMIGNHAKYNGEFTSVSIGDYTELT